MITPAKMGWMAGIIDLKGRVYVKESSQRNPSRPTTTRQIVLMVDSRFPGIIRELGALTGTKPEARSDKAIKEFMRRSCTEHCPEAHIHVNDDRIMPSTYRWTITGVSLAVVLDALEPILTEDKGFLEFKEEILSSMDLGGRGSSQILAALNRLQVLGWPMPVEIMQDLERREVALEALTRGGGEDEQEQAED